MKLNTKKELIYIAMAFCNSVVSLTWVQMAYNDPSTVTGWIGRDWWVIGAISAFLVFTQTLIAWKAYLSDPKDTNPKPKE